MILFIFSCIVFFFALSGMYYQQEAAEMEIGGGPDATSMMLMTLGIAIWAVCVAFAIKTTSAFVLCAALLCGFIISFFVEVNPEAWLGKTLYTILEVAVPALAFVYIVSYLYPRA